MRYRAQKDTKALPDLLAAEDDPTNRFVLNTLLENNGYSSLCVENGRQALEALLLRPFTCVVTDIQMPDMDGIELLRRIREQDTADIEPSRKVRTLLGFDKNAPVARRHIPHDIPVIVLTAQAVSEHEPRFHTIGMDYYLTKPIIVTELTAILACITSLTQAPEKILRNCRKG